MNYERHLETGGVFYCAENRIKTAENRSKKGGKPTALFEI